MGARADTLTLNVIQHEAPTIGAVLDDTSRLVGALCSGIEKGGRRPVEPRGRRRRGVPPPAYGARMDYVCKIWRWRGVQGGGLYAEVLS